MDEILTRWASDLTKYTKEFKTQAETVAKWDQVLVDNMSKISKLYTQTATSEKQTASVEMQLTAVENQQNELESWLTKYEHEVDEMLAKNGPSQDVGGPDQERERTFKLAEKLDERLDDMSKDLESMIEEVNAANASLNRNSKADEPVSLRLRHPAPQVECFLTPVMQITQIVRILNSHLTQLQAIDQGTVALQEKISKAQKNAQGLGHLNNGSAGTGTGVVEDFYRSYMGRR
jgi:nuclear pore complex protein Nup62